MEKYDVKFKKKYGQNFLKNLNLVEKIVNVADLDKESLVIEVGPGGGIMTRELASRAKNVLAYEIDEELKEELFLRTKDYPNVQVLFQDFLKSNIVDDIKNYSYDKLFFISNVPYYITTPIIEKIIESHLSFHKIVLMVQKEVGDRFSSSPGSKSYGSISVFLQTFYDIKKEFFVSRKNFVPEPNVDSVIISLTENQHRDSVKDFDIYQKLIRDCFQFKRKTLKNNLKNYPLSLIEPILIKHGFSLSSRAEQLPYSVFVEMANQLYEHSMK